MRGEHFDVDLFAALERDGEARIVVEIEELHRRGFDGGDENVDSAGGELPQCRCSLLLYVGVRREIFKGKDVMRGKADDAGRIDGSGQLASGLEERFKSFGGLVVGDDHDDRLPGGPRHQRKIESPRRCG